MFIVVAGGLNIIVYIIIGFLFNDIFYNNCNIFYLLELKCEEYTYFNYYRKTEGRNCDTHFLKTR